MKKFNKILPAISIKTFAFVYMIIACTIVMLIYSYGVNRMYHDKYRSEVVERIKSECNVLETCLKEENFNVKKGGNVEHSMYSLANHVEGRVMIINSEYVVIGDSNSINKGSIMFNKDVITAIDTGEESELNEKDGFIQYVRPVEIEETVVGAIVITASLKGLENFTNVIYGKNALFFGLIILVGVIFALIFGTACSRGVRMVNKRMQIVGDGHLEEKIPVRGFKEIQDISQSYNDTISKLKEIDSTRQEFVSNVSHELKTPITSMKVLADSLVQNEEADLAMYKDFMTDIVDEIDRESQIINDLLTLVKFDKQSAEMNLEEVSINNLLEITLKRVTPIAKSRGIEITYESYRDVVAIVDEVKLGLALTNIIENAVKYNVDNGWVKVTLNADHKFFHIKVADSGVGIPEDCKDKVFERFYRVDKARSRDTGGTGLGLAITKNVILLHNGSIKLYSESGEGTTFTIKIPINK